MLYCKRDDKGVGNVTLQRKDFYRFQKKFNSKQKRTGKLATVLREAKKKLNIISKRFYITDTYMLYSKKGGPVQEWHTDWKPEEMNSAPPGSFPASAIIALQNNTVVWFKKRKKFKEVLQKGEMMVIKGDCVHAGGGYNCNNYRLHFHLGLTKLHSSENKINFTI